MCVQIDVAHGREFIEGENGQGWNWDLTQEGLYEERAAPSNNMFMMLENQAGG